MKKVVAKYQTSKWTTNENKMQHHTNIKPKKITNINKTLIGTPSQIFKIIRNFINNGIP
jgi:hypothetical protein